MGTITELIIKQAFEIPPLGRFTTVYASPRQCGTSEALIRLYEK
jgi:hypothetical protein